MAISRRSFLVKAGVTGSALALGYYFSACKGEGEVEKGAIELFKLNMDNEAKGLALNPYIVIDPAGEITIFAHKPEMGQGTFQSIPQLIAEELDVSLDQVTLKVAKGNPAFLEQSVGGSYSVRGMWEPMRKVGAGAREMLVQAAANQWKIAPADCETENGKVINKKTKETLSYAQLVTPASKLEVPKDPKLKDPKDFKYIGKTARRKDIEWKVDGTANFGIDMKTPGMVYASIERAPNFAGKIKSIDDTQAKAVKGVLQVVRTERKLMKHVIEAVAVIADSYWSALQGRKALKIEWTQPEKIVNTPEVYENYKKLAGTDGLVHVKNGKFESAFASAPVKVEADYETPFASHAPMEPMNCLVDVREKEVEVWASTQVPDWSRELIAEYLSIPKEKIIINVSFLGGAFGRRLLSDFILEGCHLSKQLKKPVKVIWTREDDMTQGPYRPGGLNRVRGGLDASGNVLALEHKVVIPDIDYSLNGTRDTQKAPGGPMDPISDPFYKIPNFQSRYVFADVDPIPLVWWRSVYASTNVFAQESFMDELAIAAKKDPVAFRMSVLKEKRDQEFLTYLAEKAEWSKPLPKGWGRGIAISHSFNTTAGHVVELSRGADGKIIIERVVTAIDLGIAVNPDGVKSQCEGNIVMGLTAALKDAITFKNSQVEQSNFDTYRLLRIHELPKKVEIHIKPSTESPSGAGEPALPPMAPALANAIFNLTGKRLRKLPFDINQI